MPEFLDIANAFILLATYGSQLALGALGITLVYSILRFSNFAHGDLMAFGTMLTILTTWAMQSVGINFGILPTALLALPFGICGAILLSLFFDKSVYKFYRINKSPPVIFVIVSTGVMFVTNAIVRFIIGPGDQRFMDGEKFLFRPREFKAFTGLNEGLALKSMQVLTVTITIIAVAALFYFLQKTKTGKAMRAYSDNEDLALLSGINPDRVILVTWIIVATLATIAGTLYGLDKSFKPFTYFMLLLPMFAAAIVGGIGSPIGAIAGGYVIAFSEVMVTYAYKKFLIYLMPESMEPSGLAQLLSTDYKFAVSFIILVVVLLIRPTGLFRGKTI